MSAAYQLTHQPKTKFAMARKGLARTSSALSAPPYEIDARGSGIDIYFNMFGIAQGAIKLACDPSTRSLTVFAEREKDTYVDQFLWVFSLPETADFSQLETRYQSGVVQLHLPTAVA